MTHWTERLSEYLDGELTASEHEACARHLAACAECRTTLDDSPLSSARPAPTPLSISGHDLWPGVLARISPDAATADGARVSTGPGEIVTFPSRAGSEARKRIAFTLPQLALAASLLVAVSASVAYVAAGRGAARPATTTVETMETPIQAQADGLLPPTLEIQRANFADAEFDRAVADLERVLADRRDQLDPRTVIVIERNLAAIDQAIREAQAALDADPANTFLNSHLADARRKKLALLRQAMLLQIPSGD